MRQQYQGCMPTISGSAPITDSFLQPCPGHKRKLGCPHPFLEASINKIISRAELAGLAAA